METAVSGLNDMSSSPMKKFALSAFVIAASGAYVWSQAGTIGPLPAGADRSVASTGEALKTPETATPPAPSTAPAPSAAPARSPVPSPSPAPAAIAQASAAPPSEPAPDASTSLAGAAPAPEAPAAPKLVKASATAPAAGGDPIHASWSASHSTMFGMIGMGFSDGTYLGPVVDAYYGVVQVEAVIKHGRIDTIDVPRWPADRNTSVIINEQALPKLRDEAISAQSADVDIISGATLLSKAFIQSLGVALKKAHV